MEGGGGRLRGWALGGEGGGKESRDVGLRGWGANCLPSDFSDLGGCWGTEAGIGASGCGRQSWPRSCGEVFRTRDQGWEFAVMLVQLAGG